MTLYRAPGRVNLIGDHTDYNDGLVLPAAIDLFTCVAVERRIDYRLVIHSSAFDETVEIDLRRTLAPRRHWSDYIVGVIRELDERGVVTPGLTIQVRSDIPPGSGLSSSAALEIATAFAVADTTGAAIDPMALAVLCQRAENAFVGARVGLMDQFIVSHGVAGKAMLLDCRSLTFEAVPLPPDMSLVVCNSMVRHDHASGGYNQRRAECERALQRVRAMEPSIASLRDIDTADISRVAKALSPAEAKRVRHVVTENARVLAMCEALRMRDLDTVGRCMEESHQSLRDDYEVSVPELDLLVDLAVNRPGVYGARMTGGGFGGCTIALVQREAVPGVVRRIAVEYEARTKRTPDIFVCASADGVQRAAS